MNCKSLSFFLVLFLAFTSATDVFSQQKVSILGDSYSTYYGYVTPDTNSCWYCVPGEKKENDVTKVEETWWYRFINDHGYQLEINNSYSGATICNTGYKKADYTDRSFITRMSNLGKPDVIFIFGGTANIRLHDIDKQWGHPSVQGMKSISEQLQMVLAPN